jgi:hypothetical protein
MSASLSLPALDHLRTHPAPDEISLGTVVKVSPCGGRSKWQMAEEGVVMEIIWKGEPVRTTGILYAARLQGSRSTVTRYVVQCEHYRVVRRAAELVVVAL